MRQRTIASNVRSLTLVLAGAFLVTSIGVAYWTLVEADALSSDAFNPRLIAATRDRPRGDILSRTGQPLAHSVADANTFKRQYSDRSLAQVVGYASFKYGVSGAEGAYADSLIGQDPADPFGRWRARYLGERTPPGAVVLGVDPRVQAAAVAALAGRRGAVVALDPRTGAILASVSLPTFDPNLIVDGAQQDAAWQQLTADPQKPLINRASQGLYPPGSTFKLVVTAAALEVGGLDPKAKIRVDDPYRADPSWGSYAVRSASGSHGDFDLSLAYQRSENIYFAKIGLATGGPKLAEYAARFGIGRAPAVDLPTATGQLSKTGGLDRPTLVADTSFGQGELLVSPLQMALVAAAIADRGVMPTPHYALEVRDSQGHLLRAIAPAPAATVIRPETAATITQAMVDAVQAPGAFAAGARVPGVVVAGKTGTAEVPSGLPDGWFVGFAPAQSPTVVVAVVIENSPKGGEDAAPVGAAVIRAALGTVTQ